MDLSPEDQLRLNVLLAHEPLAIRIDESSMTVRALAGGNEAQVPLHPNCRAEQYLRRVRELLSCHALGSPGGYPVFLQRWTRWGQHRDGQLEKLLLLGEPEAVVAVAGAPRLTVEIARRVWWLMPEADIARRMLDKEAIAQSPLGRTIAAHLVEHLPFETDAVSAIETVRLVLRPGLIDEAMRLRLWQRGNHRNAYRLGFLEADPHLLPEPLAARAELAAHETALAALVAAGNAPARLLARLLGGGGQTFLAVSGELLRHPIDKYTVARLLNVIGEFFAPLRDAVTDADQALALLAEPSAMGPPPDALDALLAAAPGLQREVAAMRALALVNEELATSILARTTATGTLLRRKLEPVTGPLLAQYAVLRGERA
jgi:hypothetical protein